MSAVTEMSPSVFYYEQVDEVKDKWLEFAKTLPEESRAECEKKVFQIALGIIGRIREFYFLGTTGNLQKKTDELNGRFDQAASKVCKDNQAYLKGREAIQDQLDQVDEKLKKPLERPSSLVPMQGTLKTTGNFHKFALDHAERKDPHHSSEFPSGALEIMQAKSVHKFEHRYGKSRATGVELGLEIGKEYLEEDHSTDNPVRDPIISGASHVVMAEMIGKVIAHRTAPGIIIGGAHLISSGAEALEPKVHYAFNHPSVFLKALDSYCLKEDPDCIKPKELELAIVVALKSLQLPAQALHEVHHYLKDIASEACDALGLTDKRAAEFFHGIIQAIIDSADQPLGPF